MHTIDNALLNVPGQFYFVNGGHALLQPAVRRDMATADAETLVAVKLAAPSEHLGEWC